MILKNTTAEDIKIDGFLHEGSSIPNVDDNFIRANQQVDTKNAFTNDQVYRRSDIRDCIMCGALVLVANDIELTSSETIGLWKMTPFFWPENDEMVVHGEVGATIDIKLSAGFFQKITLTQDTTLSISESIMIGKEYLIEIEQDVTGGHNVILDATITDGRNHGKLFSSGLGSEKMILKVIYDGDDYIILDSTKYF